LDPDLINIVNYFETSLYFPTIVKFSLNDLYSLVNNLIYNFEGACQWLMENTVDADNKRYLTLYDVNQSLLKCGWALLRLYYQDLSTDVDTKIIEQALTPSRFGYIKYAFDLQSQDQYSSLAYLTSFIKAFTQNFLPK